MSRESTATGRHADRNPVGLADSRVTGRGCGSTDRVQVGIDRNAVGGADVKSATCDRSVGGPSRAPACCMTAAVTAILIDLRDLEAMLHILTAEGRGDEDNRRALRLLARHAERVEEQVERLDTAGGAALEEGRFPPKGCR